MVPSSQSMLRISAQPRYLLLVLPRWLRERHCLHLLHPTLQLGKGQLCSHNRKLLKKKRKRIVAILLEGVPVAVIDNCEHPLASDVLCTVLTETSFQDRLLGVSRTVRVPTTTTWAATGNNLKVDGDLSSRVVLCELDPQCEKPEERSFERNLHQYVPEFRGELASAALTIVRGYLEAGSPVKRSISTFGRYEEWSSYVREPLVWLGRADPCETRTRVKEGDSVRDALGTREVGHHRSHPSPRCNQTDLVVPLASALARRHWA
jgi:hypothetical protein